MIEITSMQPDDWQAVREIYLSGIATGQATFEMKAPDWETWDQSHIKSCRLIARDGESILGWAALSPVSKRAVYAGVAEVSIYIAESARGRGVGRALLTTLISESEQAGFWTLQSSTFPENVASVKLHLACGFREMGRRERIAQHNGIWRDTVILERRSKVNGM